MRSSPSAQACAFPAAIRTAGETMGTRNGTAESLRAPEPSWNDVLAPQQNVPASPTAQECSSPAATRTAGGAPDTATGTGVGDPAINPTCPRSLAPQHAT